MDGTSPAPAPDVRSHNASLVLRAVARAAARGEPAPSRAQVAVLTGLTRATVSTLVDELIGVGAVDEADGVTATGRPGRPGSPLQIAPMAPLGVGVEIDVDVLAVTAVSLDGVTVARVRRAEDLHRSRPGPVLERAAALVQTIAPDRRIAGVGVAVAGFVDLDGVLRRAPNLRNWRDVDIAAQLQPLLSTPIVVDNDANLAALAHRQVDTRTDFAFVSGEIGVGAGLVLGGQVFRGGHGFAGEFGHVVADPRGPKCGCGGQGCVEQYAGEEALLRAARVTAPDVVTQRAALIAAVTDGDRAARAAVRRAGRALGVGVASLVNLVDVREIVLGGLYVDLLPWLRPALTEELTKRIPGRVPTLTASTLGEDAAVRGAAIAAVQGALERPLERLGQQTARRAKAVTAR